MASYRAIEAHRVAFLGISQAGWIVPAAVRRSHEVAFAVLLSGSTVSLGEEELFSRLTGDDACRPTGIPMRRVERRVAAARPSRFDPAADLERLRIPVLWVYGSLDKSQPVAKDLPLRARLRRAGQPFDAVVLPRATHELFVSRTGTAGSTRRRR